MLQSLTIKNVALIKDIEIDFENGLNILLGETGAGKSIIFDALNFVLGNKVDKTLIRNGEKEMRVDAIFSSLSDSAYASLESLGIAGDELLLSRSYSVDGKSTIRINGLLSTQALLKEVGLLLVDSYSQHENVLLLKSKTHLGLLDKFGGEKIDTQKSKVKELFNQLSEIRKKIESLGGDEFERERKISLLEYQINEIESANLIVGEDDEVFQRLKFLQSAERIFESVSRCRQLLSESGNSCEELLNEACDSLANVSQFDDINECRERLESARYEIEDIGEQLKSIAESTDYNQKEYDKLDARGDLIRSITKKYGGSIEKTLEFLDKAKQEMNELEDSEFLLQKLNKQKEEVYSKLLIECENLSNLRHEMAASIKLKLLDELKELGMKSSEFEVIFDKIEVTSNGMDSVEFVFSANKGQEVKSLSKTASGGELSRFMLAFKNIFASYGEAQTLIFDEIDSGISGETGNIVGAKLKKITKNSQVICITHLPQVACKGDHFFYVSKMEDNDTTVTTVKKLDEDEIEKCIAHMIVGDNITQTALQQAKELRQSSQV